MSANVSLHHRLRPLQVYFHPDNQTTQSMDELPIIKSFCLRKGFWDRLVAVKKCMTKGCLTSKKTSLGGDYRFFATLLSEMDLGNRYKGSVSFWLNKLDICSKIYQLTFLHEQKQGLLWNWRRFIVSKFGNICYKSPRNKSISFLSFYDVC